MSRKVTRFFFFIQASHHGSIVLPAASRSWAIVCLKGTHGWPSKPAAGNIKCPYTCTKGKHFAFFCSPILPKRTSTDIVWSAHVQALNRIVQ